LAGPARARATVIKAHVARMRANGAKAAALRLRYIERDGVEKDGSKGRFCTAGRDDPTPRPSGMWSNRGRFLLQVASGMSHPHLDRAPIVEALIDFRVEPEFSSLQVLEPFQREVSSSFPDQKRVLFVSSNVDLSDQDAPKITTAPPDTKGYAFWSSDKRRVVQARVNGFSFSHVGPYDRWEVLREDARVWWRTYREATHPERVTRCALRFINRLELPLPMRDLSDYLKTVPQIAVELPQTLSGLFMRLVVPFPEATAIITQAVDDAGVTPQKLPVILDIDVFVERAFDPSGDELWSRLEELRTIKNEVFFKSLTPEAVDLFR
jgi:uncharacterized protein (TIGR04255 family)